MKKSVKQLIWSKKTMGSVVAVGALVSTGAIFGLSGYFGGGEQGVPEDTWTRGLVAAYNFDEGSGQIAYNAADTGSANDGTLGSSAGADSADPSWVKPRDPSPAGSGRQGSALSFDGANDYVDCGDIIETSVKSVEFWVKPDAVDVTEEVLDLNGTQYVRFTSGTVTGENFASPTVYVDGSAASIVTADWHHIVITTETGFSASDVDIGRLESSTYFNGAIDSVKIYNRALSAEEVRYHYNRGGPVAHWSFDEGVGTRINNQLSMIADSSSMNSNSLSMISNDSYHGSIRGSALDFDGDNDYVDCGSDTSLKIGGALTIEAWIKPTIGTFQNIVANYNNDSYAQYRFAINTAGTLRFNTGNGGVAYNLATTYTIPADTWTYVVITRTAADGNVFLYINGIEKALAASDAAKIPADGSVDNTEIGASGQGCEWFNGSIDSVRIYNEALHATTIANHYKGDYGTYEKTSGGSDLTSDDLVLYIPFDDEAGTTATNYGDCGGTPANCDGALATSPGFADTSAKAGDSSDSGWVIDTNWTSARQNTGLSFGGVNGFFQSDNYIPAASSTSHSLWFKSSNGTYAANEYLFAQGDDDPSAFIDTSGNVNVMADNALKITSAATVLDTKWHHLEITGDGTNLKLYLDSVLNGSCAFTGSSDSAGISAGAHISRSGFFDGVIDDFKVYDYARSLGEIRLDYNAGFAVRLGGGGGRASDSGGDPTSSAACSLDPASCMDLGLVASYDFDEGDGQTLYNAADTGSVNNGTLGSSAVADSADPTWRGLTPELRGQTPNGPNGGVLDFDGSNDYVNCGNDPSLDITDAITIEAWVKVSDFSQNKGIFTKSDLNNDMGVYTLQHSDSGGILRFRLNGQDVEGSGQVSATPPSNNVWHHIVATYNKINQKIYIDGEVAGTADYTTAISTNSDPFYIGVYYNTAYTFSGSIDSVRIYNRALSAEEVRYHYNRGGPVAHWRFDEGSGQYARDAVGDADAQLGSDTTSDGDTNDPAWAK